MKIETWALSKIKPYKNNPRKNDGAVPAVAESIKAGTVHQLLLTKMALYWPGIPG